MRYEGKVYRPWMEANSLLIQATIGCTNNSCTFCDMFREKKFLLRKIKDVLKDIESARRAYNNVESFFLTDGNVMAMKTEYLLKVIKKIKETFPECKKISVHSQLKDFRRKSVEELTELREAGLTIAYVGLESGDDEILKFVNKKMTAQQAIEGMEKAKQAGIRVLASFIFGLGGKEKSKQHIEKTSRILNILKPEEIAPMALAVQPGTILEEQIKSGEFIQATPAQIIEEERYLVENIDFPTFYWGDHGNNIVYLKGNLPEEREEFLARIEHEKQNNPVLRESILRTFSW